MKAIHLDIEVLKRAAAVIIEIAKMERAVFWGESAEITFVETRIDSIDIFLF